MWFVLELHHGDSHIQGSRCGGRASKERLGCPKSGHGCPGGVELVLGLHQVFRGGETSDGASLCESRGQARGVPGWWN